ncbi:MULTISPECIES: hypothetical protein [Sphingobacterium]|uniref:hypothetical protein n=1 Tax=Sphingobacterium TaxID=28453 RepID=UPI000ECA16E6|nr:MULTISPECIES: hypothetical protein [Sphingobacterium]HAF33555.1 hypothetical protein [Sphingobacterium sp.]
MATKTTIRNYHCNACENGIVMVKRKQSGNRFSFNFGDCNSCKKGFGLFSIDQLKEVTNFMPSDGIKVFRQVMVKDRLPELGEEHISCFTSPTAGASTFSKVTERVLEVLEERYLYWLEEI